MTQTPASGPLGPATTPPISSLSIATAAGCWARDGAAKVSTPAAAARVKENRIRLRFIASLPVAVSLPLVVGASLHQIRVEARACHARDFLMLDAAHRLRASQQHIWVASV